MVSHWLITGGCGFIGTSLIQALLEANPQANIRVLDNLTVGSRSDLAEVCDYSERPLARGMGAPSGVELCVGDIRSQEDALTAAEGVACVVHLAANTGVGPSVEDPKGDMEANVVGTFNQLEAARLNGVKKFIFASSGAPIGELKTPPIHEELAAHPVSPYGASKLAGEGYCSAYFGSYGVQTIALRFGNVYGPRSKNKASVVAKFIKAALAGETCEIYGDGTQTRDFIYIRDLVDAVVKAAESDVGGEVFQIASNKEVTVNEAAAVIKDQLALRGVDMNLVNGSKRTGDVQRNFSDTSKAESKLGWRAQTDLNTGIASTISYFM